MSLEQKDHQRTFPNSTPRSTGIHGCLWMLLGAGVILVVAGVGLLLAFLPNARQQGNQVSPAAETATRTLSVSVPATYTPYHTLTDAPILEETSTPTPYDDPSEQPSIPNDLLASTPTAREGAIAVSPYITADAMHFSLQTNQEVSLDWMNYPPGAFQYHFLLLNEMDGTYRTLGVDENPADGVSISWLVPENTKGKLQGIAVFPDGHLESSFSGGWVGSSAAD